MEEREEPSYRPKPRDRAHAEPAGQRFRAVAAPCLAAAVGLVYLASRATGSQTDLVSHISLVPALVLSEPWRLVTAPFAQPVGEAIPLLLNLALLFLLGQETERAWGPARFLRFSGWCAIGGGCVHLAAFALWRPEVATSGPGGIALGLVAAAILEVPDRQIAGPVRLRHVAIGGGAIALALGLGDAWTARGVGPIGGLLCGIGWVAMGPALARQRQGWQRRRQANALEKDLALEAEVDRILAKITARGMGALTSGERRALHRASARLRNAPPRHEE